MDVKVKLYFDVKQIYNELTPATVDAYIGQAESYEQIKTRGISEYTTAKDAGVTTIHGKDNSIVTRIKGNEIDVMKCISETASNKAYNELKDGLLVYIYNDAYKGETV